MGLHCDNHDISLPRIATTRRWLRRTLRIACLSVALNAALLVLAHRAAAGRETGTFRPAHSRCPAGGYTSPDGKYLAEVRLQLDIRSIRIYRLHRTTSGFSRKDPVSRTIPDIEGFVWVPKRGHTLVVAAGGDYGPPLLAMWDGSKPRKLHTVRGRGDLFELYGVSADGAAIIYSYHRCRSSDTMADVDRDLATRQRMKLPKQ
jgi:hypothetical protein